MDRNGDIETNKRNANRQIHKHMRIKQQQLKTDDMLRAY